ncbi:MAG: PadR family transcriptional regulator [Longimicrobiales bacterium]
MRVDLLQGTLDMLILKALSWDGMHGYGILSWLEQESGAALVVEEGSLYPALHRMSKRGWVKAEWGLSENNRRARYYTLTAAGRKQLQTETATWERFTGVIARVMAVQTAKARA